VASFCQAILASAEFRYVKLPRGDMIKCSCFDLSSHKRRELSVLPPFRAFVPARIAAEVVRGDQRLHAMGQLLYSVGAFPRDSNWTFAGHRGPDVLPRFADQIGAARYAEAMC